MRIHFKKTNQHPTTPFCWAGSFVEITAELEDDDSKQAISTNSGHANIELTGNSARFAVPLNIVRPHPDLIALIALKLFSPYIGSELRMQEPVSPEFANEAINTYPNLKKINSSSSQRKRAVESEHPAISFSGGADSVAAASVLSQTTPLIQLVRMDHPLLPRFEHWYKTEANIKTIESMPQNHPKYTIFSDMEFLSTNKRWCVYPDAYAFTIPVMMLADTLNLSHVITGDVWVAFTGDETIFHHGMYYRHRKLFTAAGLDIEYPCNGIGEIGSYILSDKYLGNAKCNTCQYGDFMQPCMKCIKCFRKSLIGDAIFGTDIVLQNLDRFNNSPAILNYAKLDGRKATAFSPTYKWCFERIGYSKRLKGAALDILKKCAKLNLDVGFCDGYIDDVYSMERPDFAHSAKQLISKEIRAMSRAEKNEFSRLNWQENGVLE